MKLITVIIIGVFTITSAIRVPTSWPKKQNVQHRDNKFRSTVRSSEIAFQPKPHVGHMHKHNKINIGRKYQQNVRHNLKKPQERKEFKASATLDDWKPVFPVQMIQKDQFFFNIKGLPSQYHQQIRPTEQSPLYKNYRDDKTHEPNYEEQIEEKHIHRGKPLSQHEVPLDVPTRPIYPGEGQWAKKGIKHRPHVTNHQFNNAHEEDEDEDEKPDGYETFEKNKHLFERQKNRFQENVNKIPENESDENSGEDKEDYDEEEEQEFVPIKLYTQVRRSESAKHLPKLEHDPRLREVIKDSKIQTVYSEEGYEDLAYDHAGHEKTAEEDEGFAEFDKEIERARQKKARQRNRDSEGSGSQYKPVRKPFKIKKGEFSKTQQVKTMALKDHKLGDTDLEVVSGIEILRSPNNGTKTQKYVKIFPKVYRYDKVTTELSNSEENTVTTEVPKMLVMESTMQKSFYKRRFKRFVNDFPNLEVDTDFIGKISHKLPVIQKNYEKPKYPYYNDPTLNPLSPLRYAEDLDRIPKKTEDELAFYNQADKLQCPEVETDVDPIPARIKNAENDPDSVEDSTDVQELVKKPRLKNLGDKIDCFKVKYFGEDPLDSPFFKEKEIGKVVPFFNIFNKNKKTQNVVNKNNGGRKYSAKYSRAEIANAVSETNFNILKDVVDNLNKSKEATAEVKTALKVKNITNSESQSEGEVISIITTPKYTIDLKPKHIYHQIELLQYLPQYKKSEITENSTNPTLLKERMGKSVEDITTVAPTEKPKSQPLKHRRRLRPRPKRPKRPYYQVFDINKYLPKTNYNLVNRIVRTSTVLPKGSKSEVHYKEEIKPSEQLNVFADVINNIKNSSKDPEQIAVASSNRVTSSVNSINFHYKDWDMVKEENTELSTSTTTIAPRGTIKYSSYKTKEQLFEELSNRDKNKYENLELFKIKRFTTTEPYSRDKRISETEKDEENHITEAVVGLMPPAPKHYKTIVATKLTKPEKMNLFYFLGMKPPSKKVYIYSDFKIVPNSKRKMSYVRRSKRSPQRKAYSEVVRNRNKPIDVEDDTEAPVKDDDDYVPHRPRNYHYDEKTGRIVYDKVDKETEAPEEEYIEVTDAPLPKPTRRNSATTTKYEIKGPSYVDFVKKLKSDATYKEITDPPPTEKNEEAATTTTTTISPVSTDPPEYLSFLSKLKSNPNYKEIADKTTPKSKTTTTENPEEEEEEEQEESQLDNVQNSPGGQKKDQSFQIFDINDYLPKVKNYTPRTSIDYSKYKTISRPMSASNREDTIETSSISILAKGEEKKRFDEKEFNPVMSESKHEDVVPSTTTTEVSKTTRRVRTRTRGRPTRKTTTTSTTASSITTTQTETSQGVQSKTKRVFPRRRGSRIKINRTTELPDIDKEGSSSLKIIRRRHQKSQESNDTTPLSTETEETTKVNETSKENNKSPKVSDVQVFQKYDQSKKHGGNYRKINEEESETKKSPQVTRLTDIVPKPSAYYTDPKLPTKINHLMEGKTEQVTIEEPNEDNEEEPNYDYEISEEKPTTTKKPVFVKDPEKRLYYYAPV